MTFSNACLQFTKFGMKHFCEVGGRSGKKPLEVFQNCFPVPALPTPAWKNNRILQTDVDLCKRDGPESLKSNSNVNEIRQPKERKKKAFDF